MQTTTPTPSAALPEPETYEPSAAPPEVHLVLYVGVRAFLYPGEPTERRPAQPLGEAQEVLAGHGITAPAWAVEPQPLDPPARYTLVTAEGACVSEVGQRWLLGIGLPGVTDAEGEVTWTEALELAGCGLGEARPVGGVYWTELAVVGELPEGRFLEVGSPEEEDRAQAEAWLSEFLGSPDNAYSALREPVEGASFTTFAGEPDLQVVRTSVDPAEVGFSSLVRVAVGGRVVATFRDADVNGLLALGPRRFTLIQGAESREHRLYELTAERALDAGPLAVE